MNIRQFNLFLSHAFAFLSISSLCSAQTIIDRNTNQGKIKEIRYETGDMVIQKTNFDTNSSNTIAYSNSGNIRFSYSTCGFKGADENNYDGAYIEYYESGQVKSIKYYECGIATGVWYDFFESGKIKSQKGFIYDSIGFSSSAIEYDITIGGHGMGSSSTVKFSGLPNGKWLEWYENGNLAIEKYFIHGIEENTWVWYYENGSKRKEGTFYSDTLIRYPDKVKMIVSPDEIEDKIAADFFPHILPKHGKWQEWNNEGKLKTERYYYKGKLEKEIKF